MKVRHISFKISDKRGIAQVARVHAGKHEVQVYESPTGRAIQIHVDGLKVWPQ